LPSACGLCFPNAASVTHMPSAPPICPDPRQCPPGNSDDVTSSLLCVCLPGRAATLLGQISSDKAESSTIAPHFSYTEANTVTARLREASGTCGTGRAKATNRARPGQVRQPTGPGPARSGNPPGQARPGRATHRARLGPGQASHQVETPAEQVTRQTTPSSLSAGSLSGGGAGVRRAPSAPRGR
jgi:hypothetical protein